MNPGFRIEPTADKFTVSGPYNEDLSFTPREKMPSKRSTAA